MDETEWEDYSMRTWWNPSIEWGEGTLDGADQFYRVNLEFIFLKTENSDDR
jgi:hypothetical protein